MFFVRTTKRISTVVPVELLNSFQFLLASVFLGAFWLADWSGVVTTQLSHLACSSLSLICGPAD